MSLNPLIVRVSPKKVTIGLSILVFLFTVAGVAVQVAKYVFDYRQEWTRLFNLDRELNYPSTYATLTLFVCAFLLMLIANYKKQEKDRFARHWKILAIVFVCFAIDEAFSIHEILIIKDLRKALNLGGIFYFVWVIPGTLFVGWFCWTYWKFFWHLPRRSRLLFFLAGASYVGGALGGEMVSGFYADLEGANNLIYGLIVCAEEVLEMVGVIIFINALLTYLRPYLQEISIQLKLCDD